MAKVVYTKRNEFKLFGVKLFEFNTNYSERSSNKELDEDDFQDMTENSETLAGMLLAIKGDFPKEKEPIVYRNCRFLILEIEHHRITSVRVKVTHHEKA